MPDDPANITFFRLARKYVLGGPLNATMPPIKAEHVNELRELLEGLKQLIVHGRSFLPISGL